MAQEYRYPLTRVCLRGGTMTLPRTMLGLFPESGSVVVVDTAAGVEYEAQMSHPRVVAGLGPLYRAQGLDVNDELLVAPGADGRFSITPVKRPRAADTSPAALADMLNEFAEAGVAATEAEIHALFPDLPDGFELAPYLEADPRFELHNGRWQRVGTGGEEAQARGDAGSGSGSEAETEAEAASVRAEPVPVVAEGAAALDEMEPDGAQRMWAGAAVGTVQGGGGSTPQMPPGATNGAPTGGSQQGSLWGGADEGPRRGARRSAAFEDDDDNEAALAAVALTARLRHAFAPLGFRLEPLAAGLVMMHADLGRRNYKVLVQLLRGGERLDWAALLARRRNSPANYLAVVGDGADLLRLTNPAELARATLWSWQALERMVELHGSVPVSPIDLESHFGRDGLFEAGLKRFEQSVAARVAERGATSEVLTRLALQRAPSVFLLEDLAQDAAMGREAVLRILERLAEAPFHLVAKVGSGEFLLRQPVADALAGIAAYAESLRERLPRGRREVLTGIEEEQQESEPFVDELLSDDDVEAETEG